MKIRLLVIIAIILVPMLAFSQEIIRLPDEAKKKVPTPPESFKDYVPYAIDYRPGWGANYFLFLAPELSTSAEMYRTSSDQETYNVRFPIGESMYSVSYDPGPSGDPNFVISSPELKTYASLEGSGLENTTSLYGETLYVSSSGSFYVATRTNEDYLVKRKFVVSDGWMKEVKQAFYLVGSHCTTSAELVIYEKYCGEGEIIARIPEGMKVNVLLNETTERGCKKGEQYLVATSFGLVGWVASSSGYMHFRRGELYESRT